MGVITKTSKSQQSRLKMRLYLVCLILYSAYFVFGIPLTNKHYAVRETVQAAEDLPMSDEINSYGPIDIFNEVIKVGETLVDNDLYPMVDAVGATKTILTTAKKTFSKLEVIVLEAKEKIENMNVQLKSLQKEHSEFQDEYFPRFNKAKSELRQVRQRLRQLAERTITETRDLKILIESIDESDDTFLLKAAIKKMKDLMVLSKDALIEAKEKYNNAIETFEDLNSSIQIQNRFLKNLLDTESAEHKAWEEKVRAAAYGTSIPVSVGAFIAADVAGCLGFCSLFGNLAVLSAVAATTEETIKSYTAELEKFETLTGGMLASGRKIDETMKEGIAFLVEEIDILDKWSNSVDTVSNNIDNYPQEYLKKIKAIRTIFINGLNDLQTTATEFLNRGELFENDATNNNPDNQD